MFSDIQLLTYKTYKEITAIMKYDKYYGGVVYIRYDNNNVPVSSSFDLKSISFYQLHNQSLQLLLP